MRTLIRMIALAVWLLGVGQNLLAKSMFRSFTHGFTIDAEKFIAVVTDDTFTNSSSWSPERDEPPPLSAHDAYRIADRRLRLYVSNPGDYSLAEISLLRFFDSQWWYYVIRFEYPGWQEREPYRTLREEGEWTNIRPNINIVIKMDGEIVESEQWSNHRR